MKDFRVTFRRAITCQRPGSLRYRLPSRICHGSNFVGLTGPPMRMQSSFPAVFARGGTSNGLMILRSTLPKDIIAWRPILASAMGSPDSYGRQLDGMGSGISSTSKICVVEKSERPGIDIEYTFVQLGIKDGSLDMAGNCGNMSSVVGPYALSKGLVSNARAEGGEFTTRMFNTNTGKIIDSTFAVDDALQYDPSGDYSIDGVPGTGSRITLSFLDPEGAKTGRALPTGNTIDELQLPDGTKVRASLTDIANPGIFVLGSDLGVMHAVSSDELGNSPDLMSRLEMIRQEGTKRMGLDPNVQSVPKIVILFPPSTEQKANGVHIVCRALSMQQAHKAVPLTLALNLGASCRIEGTLAAQIAGNMQNQESITIAHASGRLEVGSVMRQGRVESALLHRTARFLMQGEVFYSVGS